MVFLDKMLTFARPQVSSEYFAKRLSRILLVNLCAILLAFIFALNTPSLADTPIVPDGHEFLCTPTHVWDGDGPIWCEEGPRVRLSGVNARELDGTCGFNKPCPNANAVEARDALVAMVGEKTGIDHYGHIMVTGPTMRCRSVGHAGGKRTAAWCVSPKSGDISCAMAQAGWVKKWDKYWRDHECP